MTQTLEQPSTLEITSLEEMLSKEEPCQTHSDRKAVNVMHHDGGLGHRVFICQQCTEELHRWMKNYKVTMTIHNSHWKCNICDGQVTPDNVHIDPIC